jgi:hypothetical protein
MKNIIEISNVGPIKHVSIKLNTINVFMGAQSSGKSTIAKIVSFCSWVEKNVATNQSLENYYTDKKFFIDRLETFHKMKGFFNKESKILYESNVIKLEYSSNDFKIEWIDKYAYKKNKISYIPSERSMVILPEVEKVEFPPNYLRSFLFDWFDARKQYSKEKSLSLLNIGFDYYYSESAKENHIRSIEKNNNHDILLSNASSGLQSVTPMIAMVDYLTNFIYDDSQNSSYEFDEIKTKVSNDLVSNLILSPYFKEKALDLLERKKQIEEINKKLIEKDIYVTNLFNHYTLVRENLFSTHSSNLIIEEPEQNLFPDTQRSLIYYLLNKCSDDAHQHQMTITTHSPYVLYAINNCMMANIVKDKINKNEYEKLKCNSSPIDPNDISIYQIENGELNCIQEENGLIGKNYFDEKMKELMDDFYVMLNYYE